MSMKITETERQAYRLRRMMAKPQTPEEKAFAEDPSEENFNRLNAAVRAKHRAMGFE